MNNTRVFGTTSPIAARAALIVLALAVFASTTAFASSPQGSFEKTFQVSGPVDLEVSTHSGNITVHTGSSGAVLIRAKIYVGDNWLFGSKKTDVSDIERNPPLRQQGNSIRVDYVNVRNVAIDYEITVPAETTVRTHSGSGDQTIEGTRGNTELESGSGDMKLANLTGELRVQTGSGNVRARAISGPIRGGAGSGDIEVEETGTGDVELRTGSGNVTVRGVHGGLRAEAGSGDITAEGTQSNGWEIRTGSGNVHVRLPGNSAFDADINTSSGTIDIDSPVEMTVQGRVQESRKTIKGKVRGGGPVLAVRTGSGDIHIQ